VLFRSVTHRNIKNKYRNCPFLLISNKEGITNRNNNSRRNQLGGELFAVLSHKVKLRK